MQPQSAQNIYVPQNAANNSAGRGNQPTAGNIYRQNPSSPAPRNRYVHSTAMYPAVHQSVLVGQFTAPYATRTPQLQQCQYSPQFYQHMYYPCFMPQPPQQQRAGVNSVNPVGVGLNSTIAVQPGAPVSGPTAASSQGHMPLGVAPVGGNTVINVGTTTTGQPVGVTPLVGIPHQPAPQQQHQNLPQTKQKPRSRALEIIDPITKRNVLEDPDIDKNEPKTVITRYPSTASPLSAPVNADFSVDNETTATISATTVQLTTKIPEASNTRTEILESIETSAHQSGTTYSERNFKDTTQQQTPIVSAITDAPSVEILPTQSQKQRSKKSQNGFVIKLEQDVCQSKIEESINLVSDAAATTIEKSTCVQESLPKSYVNQQVPPQINLIDKREEQTVTTKSDENLSANNSSKEKGSKENSTQNCFGANKKEISDAFNETESVMKTMKVGEGENFALPPPQLNLALSNEQQQNVQCEAEFLNATNGNTTTTVEETILPQPTVVSILNNNDILNNNIKKKNNLKKIDTHTNTTTTTTAATTTIKNDDKSDKKKSNINEKALEIAEAQKSDSSKKETSSDDIICKETDTDKLSTKKKKEKIENISLKTTTKSSTNDTPSNSCSNEKPKTAANDVIEGKAESTEKEDDEDVSARNSTEIDNSEINKRQTFEPLISYKAGQWSPSNPSGKKQYNREQLMQLREAKASRIQPEVKNTSIFSQTNLMPAFAYRGNKKVQSMVGGFVGGRGSSSGDGNYQNYMKQNSVSGRGGADSGHHNRNSGKSIIHLNLSLNQEVKLNEADNAWRPRVLVKTSDMQSDPEQNAQREKEDLIRRVRGILNKLTPEKFEPLVEEIIKLKIDTMDKMEAVMILVFEKAIDEPTFSVSYASLCHRLISEVKARDERMESGTKTNLASFRNALLDKTEQEFNYNVTKSSAKEEKLKPIREKINNCTDANEKVELEALLEEEERKIRRRSGGTVRFIGELFKISILTGKIIHNCIEVLLKDPNNEDMLECLCKLLTTVGQKFEQTQIPKDKRTYSLDSVIQRMQHIASKNENSKISSRVRFMLQDVIDLRKKNWQSTRNEAPKTMEQIEKEANNEQLSNPYNYINSMQSGSVSSKRDERGGGRNDGRNYGGSHSQRGDTGSLKRTHSGIGGASHSQSGNSNSDDTWIVQTGKGNRSLQVDSSKLVGMTVDMNNRKMGAAALFQWNNTSSQPTLAPSNSFAALSLDSNRSSDRDRSGPRNKSSYNKGSMERDRYEHERLLSRTGSTQTSRENSSSRGNQSIRGVGVSNSANIQKNSSHSKYQQPMPSSSLSRMTSSKMSGMTASGGVGTANVYRDSQQPPSYSASNVPPYQQQQHFNSNVSELPQPLSAPQAVFVDPSDSDLNIINSVITEMVENAANSKCIDNTTVSCLKKIKENQLCSLLYYILTDYLHLGKVGPMCRRNLANVVAYLIEMKYLSVEHFRLAYKKFSELASDLIVDIPELWLYIFEFTGPLLVKKLITIKDLWHPQLRESGGTGFSQKFIKTFLNYCTREVGPNFTRNVWKKNHMKWTNFMDEKEVTKFIQSNKFEYVENENMQPDIDTKETKDERNKRVVEHIKQLLKEGCTADNIMDYINGNIADVDKSFIKCLTATLTSYAIKDSNNYALDLSRFQKICIPVLLRYVDSKTDLELECLYAIQLLVHSLEHPRGLLAAIFAELHDLDVIPQDTFIAWRNSKEHSAGKGVAVTALNRFFNQVINVETSDDN